MGTCRWRSWPCAYETIQSSLYRLCLGFCILRKILSSSSVTFYPPELTIFLPGIDLWCQMRHLHWVSVWPLSFPNNEQFPPGLSFLSIIFITEEGLHIRESCMWDHPSLFYWRGFQIFPKFGGQVKKKFPHIPCPFLKQPLEKELGLKKKFFPVRNI